MKVNYNKYDKEIGVLKIMKNKVDEKEIIETAATEDHVENMEMDFDMPGGPGVYQKIAMNNGTGAVELVFPSTISPQRCIDYAAYTLLICTDEDFRSKYKSHMLKHTVFGRKGEVK